MQYRHVHTQWRIVLIAVMLFVALAGCSSTGSDAPARTEAPLRVVATTSIIADVAQNVAGDKIEVISLLPSGSDPHTWVPAPRDLVALSEADLLLINDVGLEEGLLPILQTISGPQIASVNDGVSIFDVDSVEAGVEDHEQPVDEHADEEHADDEHADEEHADEEHADDGHDHTHEKGDPHTWQDVANVRIWTQNIVAALSALDPVNAETYATNAAAYDAELAALETEIKEKIATIPPEARMLVTDHDDLGYFARAHGFTVVGTIIPSVSALASVSAQSLAALQDQIAQQGVHALFVGTTVNRDLANQIATDMGARVVPLYTDALSAPDGPAPTYLEMMRHNTDAIVEALTAVD